MIKIYCRLMLPLLTGWTVPTCPLGVVVQGPASPDLYRRGSLGASNSCIGAPVCRMGGELSDYAPRSALTGKVAAEELCVDDTPVCTSLKLHELGC